MSTGLVRYGGMSQREFGVIFAKLAMQLRNHDADEATIRSYFEALSSYPAEAVRMAADAFSREPGRKYFPTSGEWLQGIQGAVAAQLREALPHARKNAWRVECERCEDTGWVYGLTCDGGAEQWPEFGPREPRGNQKFRGNRRPVGYNAEPRATEHPLSAVCGNDRPHAPHTFTKACPCRPMNRTYQRNLRFGKGD